MNKVRTIVIDGVEIQTSLSAVEIANLPIKYAELQKQNQKYKEIIDKAIEYLETKRIREKAIVDIDVLEGILKEVE